MLSSSFSKMKDYGVLVKNLIDNLYSIQDHLSWHDLDEYLRRYYAPIYAQFTQVLDDDGFQLVGRDPFEIWMDGVPFLEASTGDGVNSDEEIDLGVLLTVAKEDIYLMSLRDRARLVEFWVGQIQDEMIDQLYESLKTLREAQKTINQIHDEVDRRVLSTAEVIGVTTTGLARRIDVLQHVTANVLICEEAGEIMEPHM